MDRAKRVQIVVEFTIKKKKKTQRRNTSRAHLLLVAVLGRTKRYRSVFKRGAKPPRITRITPPNTDLSLYCQKKCIDRFVNIMIYQLIVRILFVILTGI